MTNASQPAAQAPALPRPVRPRDRLLGSAIDVVFVLGIAAGASLMVRGENPSPLLIVVGRLLIAAFLLGRDVAGASPGKRRMKLRVVSADGSPSDFSQRVIRNVTIVAVPVSAGIPVAVQLAWLLALAEVVLVMLGRERLGDLLAQTMVVRPETSTAPAVIADSGAGGAADVPVPDRPPSDDAV